MTVSFAIVLYLYYSTIIWLELQYTELCIHYTVPLIIHTYSIINSKLHRYLELLSIYLYLLHFYLDLQYTVCH